MNKRLALLRSAIFFAALQPWLLLAQQTPQQPFPQPPPWHWPGPWHMWGGGWGFWWFFPLLMMVIIAICIGGFFFGHRWGPWHMSERPGGLGQPWRDPTDSALRILNERFARGEIQKEEYEEKKAVIRSSA